MAREIILLLLMILAFGCANVDKTIASKPVEILPDLSKPTTSVDVETEAAEFQVLSETPTLADYLEYAALNSPELEGAFNRWKASLEVIPEVKALPDPRFTYTYYIREIETRTGPQQQKFALAQTFPWFGKLDLMGDAAFEASKSKGFEYERVKTTLFFDIKRNYYELYYLSKAADIARENKSLMEFLEAIARSKFSTGTAGHGDIIRAQVELGRLEEQILSIEDRFEPLQAQFNKSLNRPATASVVGPESIPLIQIPIPDEEILSILVKNNPSLKAADFMASKEKIEIELAAKNAYPDVTLGLEYVDTGPARMPASDSGRDPIMAMVSVNLPIWRNKYRAMEERARNEYLAELNNRQALENELISKAKLVLYDYRDAMRKFDLYGNALVPKARQALKVLEQSFAVGDSSFLDLLDAQRVLLEFQLQRENSLTVQAQKVAELEMLLGQEVGDIEQ